MKSDTVKIIITLQMGFNIIAAIIILILAILSVSKKNQTPYDAEGATTKPSVLNGNWGNWTDSSTCTTSCGSGNKTQTRVCNNPAPANGGANCVGSSNQSVTCNTNPCPVNGNWGIWTNSSTCTQTCGGGNLTQTRLCNNPAPANGGANCVGSANQSVTCNINPCPVPCLVDNIDTPANNSRFFGNVPIPKACQFQCQLDNACSSFTYRKDDGGCWMVNATAVTMIANNAIMSGSKICDGKAICLLDNVDMLSGNQHKPFGNVKNPGECQYQCQLDNACLSFTYIKSSGFCFLIYTPAVTMYNNTNFMSGSKSCGINSTLITA